MATFKTSHRTLVFLIVFIFCLWEIPFVDAILLEKVHVYVTNDFSGGKRLTVHCKSKDDDLGEHSLGVKETFEWNFYSNIWGTTLFWCNMGWYDDKGKLVQGRFDIYKAKRDETRCVKRCHWRIFEHGLYSYSSITDTWDHMYDWP